MSSRPHNLEFIHLPPKQHLACKIMVIFRVLQRNSNNNQMTKKAKKGKLSFYMLMQVCLASVNKISQQVLYPYVKVVQARIELSNGEPDDVWV